MIKIGKMARYPLVFTKGSFDERRRLARELNFKFFKEISSKFKSKDVSFDVFQKTIDEFMPYQISLKVVKNDGKNGFLAVKVNDECNLVNGYNMGIPPNPFSGEIPLTTADTFMHESAHYFSFMTNPKMVARIAKMFESGTCLKTQNFYDTVLYSKNKLSSFEISKKLDDLLQTLTVKERIDFLQNSRYRLSDEIFAYKEGAKYQDLIQKIHSDKICCKVDAVDYCDYDFETKIKIVEQKLIKELKNARAVKS